MTEEFKNLLDIYQMMQPISVAASERQSASAGGRANFWKQFFETLNSTNASGLVSLRDMNNKFRDLVSNSQGDATTLEAQHVLRVYSSNPQDMTWTKPDDPSKMYMGRDGKKAFISSLKDCYSDLEKTDMNVGVILCNSPMLSPATRNVDKAEMWLNYVPSIVLSRCVPFLDIKFELARNNLSETRAETLSVLKFLEGATELSSPTDKALLKADNRKEKRNNQDVTVTKTGMEIFLTPQTLVNPNGKSFSERYVDAVDKFRPLASLQSVELSINPEIGFMTYKNGTMSFVLHDRSRLHEISDVIRPQLYYGVTIWITYGWRHPDEANNPYAEFINNNMLMREAFKVVNVDMSFDEVGQVNIKLKIATSGAKELEIANANQSDNDNAFKKFLQIQQEVKALRKLLGLVGIDGVSNEVRPYQLLDAVESGTFPDWKKGEVKQVIDELYSSLIKKKASAAKNSTPDVAISIMQEQLDELATSLRKNLEEYSTQKEEMQSLAREKARKNFEDVVNKPDPYLIFGDKVDAWLPQYKSATGILDILEFTKSVSTKPTEKRDVTVKSPTGNDPVTKSGVVSLGKLFTTFAINAVKQLSDVSEAQFVFYQLNNNCGAMSGLNIAEFPIDYASFLQQYSQFLYNKRTDKITIKELFNLIETTQVKDVRSLAYGLSTYYKTYDPANPEPQFKSDKEKKEVIDALRVREQKYGMFQYPHLQIFVETIHVNKSSKNSSVDLMKLYESLDRDGNSQFEKIIRIHVFDKTLNPYQAEAMLIRPEESSTHLEEIKTSSSTGLYQLQKLVSQLNQVSQTIQKTQNSETKVALTNLQTSLQDAIKSQLNDTQTFQRTQLVVGGAINAATRRAIKDYVARNVPSIIYGSNGTTVKSATLSTKSDGLLETSNMIKSLSQANTMEPNGSGKHGLPLRVIPATLNMTIAGCPLISPAQVYFIDFNTGTTIDNQYVLTNVNHSISKGKFETSLTFGYLDGYARFEGAPTIFNK